MTLSYLRDRADMLAAARRFFAERGVMEVDCPILSTTAAVDAHIDILSTRSGGSETLFLHSSPEYGMKRLLSKGAGDIYQLSHVFRAGERGAKHRPEFTLAEWYRCDFSFQEMINETVAFAELFIARGAVHQLTYCEALVQFAEVDPFEASLDALRSALEKRGISVPATDDRDELLNWIMGCLIEPQLRGEGWWVITHYPASQAALSKTVIRDGHSVAERFELYGEGLELANGYHELTDADEQGQRFRAANRVRIREGRAPLPIDWRLVEALKRGLPDCCGVAVGFDRLMMLRHNSESIETVLAEDIS